MAGLTSSIITVSNYRVGPFGDRAWRARHIVTLIEKAECVWTVNPVGHSYTDGHSLQMQGVVPMPGWLYPADALVLLLAGSVVRSPEFMETLEHYGLAAPIFEDRGDDDLHMVLPQEVLYGDKRFAPEVFTAALLSLLDVVRLGVTRLDPYSQLNDDEIRVLTEAGLDVELFSLNERELSCA